MEQANHAGWLELLIGTQRELSACLNAFGGRRLDGVIPGYIAYSIAHLNNAAEGYMCLRASGRIKASKHLIRSILETFFRIQAVRSRPELIFRIAYTEHREDLTWITGMALADASELKKMQTHLWAEFVQQYQLLFPEHKIEHEKLTVLDAAIAGGNEVLYHRWYRLYCRFVHAALRASKGDLDPLEFTDTFIVVMTTLAALDALIEIGAESARFETLKLEYESLVKTVRWD